MQKTPEEILKDLLEYGPSDWLVWTGTYVYTVNSLEDVPEGSGHECVPLTETDTCLKWLRAEQEWWSSHRNG